MRMHWGERRDSLMAAEAGTSIRRAKKGQDQKRGDSAGHPRKKLWIFDFDNTLVRLEPEVDWAQSRRELEPMLRAACVPEDLFERFPRGNLGLYDAVRKRLLELASQDGGSTADFSAAQVQEILRRASAVIEKHEIRGAERASPLEGAIELVKAIRKSGAQVAIVTSNSSRTVKRWLSRYRLSAVVCAIVGRDTLLALKPSPEMLSRALQVCGVRPEDAVFVGDADSDLKAAAALGVEFFAIAANDAARDRFAGAGTLPVFPSPAALASHLELEPAPRH